MKKFWKWKNQTNPEEYLESQSLSTWYTFLNIDKDKSTNKVNYNNQ